MSDQLVNVACRYCHRTHWYEPGNVLIVFNVSLQYVCPTTGNVGWEKNDPEVITWLQSHGVPSYNDSQFAVTPSSALTADRRPDPYRYRGRGIQNLPGLTPFDGETGSQDRPAWSWLPPFVAIVYVLAVATGLVPRILVMGLAIPIAIWFGFWASKRWI